MALWPKDSLCRGSQVEVSVTTSLSLDNIVNLKKSTMSLVELHRLTLIPETTDTGEMIALYTQLIHRCSPCREPKICGGWGILLKFVPMHYL